ncbi:hypothetical protein PIROE2DRAFT_23126, partial [Piromyces sp. E2]
INKMSRNGETPLFYACSSGNVNLVKYLTEQGADVNKISHDDEIPLFNACRGGHETIVRYLVENGADINIKNKD